MKLLKFGGSSIADAESIKKVVEIIRDRGRTGRCAVVLSAMHGTTDALIEAGRSAERGDDGYIGVLSAIRDRHVETVEKLFGGEADTAVLEFVESTAKELDNICEGVRLVRELSPKTLDRILSF